MSCTVLKVSKSQDLHLFPENTFLRKPQGALIASRFRAKFRKLVRHVFCEHFQFGTIVTLFYGKV